MAQIPLSSIYQSPARGQQNGLPALAALGVLYFMMGLITCLNDTLVPFFKNSFSLTYTQSALVQFYFFFTYGIVSIPAGSLVGRFGYKRSMVLGFLVSASGTFLFFPASLMHNYNLFLAALFILAIGIVILQVAANPYISILGPAETASSRLTLIQGIGSLGTTIAPLLGSWLILDSTTQASQTSDAVRLPYLGITALLILIATIISRLSLPDLRSRPDHVREQGLSVFRFRNLKFGVIALFCYVGAEVSIGSFLTNYIVDTLAVSEKLANSFVTFYWGGMLIGRFLGAGLLKFLRPPLVLVICALSAFLLILVSINTSEYLAVWTMLAVGLFNSVMFATIFSLSLAGAENIASKASGWLSTAIVGGAVVSFVQGWLIDHYSWSVAFILPLICYSYVLFFGLSGYKQAHDS
jgi:FHS family L-fucose permease-like MFS transporter